MSGTNEPQGFLNWLADPWGAKKANRELHAAIRDKEEITRQIVEQNGTVQRHQATLAELKIQQRKAEINRLGCIVTDAIVGGLDGSWANDANSLADTTYAYRETSGMIARQKQESLSALDSGKNRLGQLQSKSVTISHQQEMLGQRLSEAQYRQNKSMELALEVKDLQSRLTRTQNCIHRLSATVTGLPPSDNTLIE
jgi:hypothetical protein